MPLKAALDTSSAAAAFAVLDPDDNVVLRLNGIPLGRETGGLTLAIIQGLSEAHVSLDEINQWTIGLGPGSFSGIRIGAAFVKGICAGTGAAYRGLPSSLAMVLSASQTQTGTVTALHDGRRGEVLVSPYQWKGDELSAIEAPYPIAIADLKERPCDMFVAMKETLLHTYLAMTAACCTRYWFSAFLSAATTTRFARYKCWHTNIDGGTANGFF